MHIRVVSTFAIGDDCNKPRISELHLIKALRRKPKALQRKSKALKRKSKAQQRKSKAPRRKPKALQEQISSSEEEIKSSAEETMTIGFFCVPPVKFYFLWS